MTAPENTSAPADLRKLAEEAAALAMKARGFARWLRAGNDRDVSPEASDYDELAGMIERLVATRAARSDQGAAEAVLDAAIERYNTVWQSWPTIDASNVDECRRAAMAAALSTPAQPEADDERVRREARPLDDWHEDHGFVVWWTWENGRWLGEPSWIGSPNDSDWPGYHTHWTPHPDFPAPVDRDLLRKGDG